MKKGWEVKPLGEVCKTGSGGTPLKSKKQYYENGNVPWLLSGEVAQGEIYKSKKLISKEGLDNSSAKLFPIDTVLVAMYGATAGQTGILKFESSTNQAVCGILPNEMLLPYFTHYFFLSIKDKLIAQAVGNAQPNISQLKIKNTLIPIPPLPEQKRIVEILDKAFEAIDQAKANLEKNIENAKELFQSKLNEVFSQKGDGSKLLKMDEICEITAKLISPTVSPYQNHFHVGGGNIVSNTGELVDLKSAKSEGLKSNKFPFDSTMVLYNKIRPYLVKVARPNFIGICSADMYPLSPLKNVITRDFLYYLLISKRFTDYAIDGSARAGMPKVNRKHLFEYECWIPEISMQEDIIKNLNQIKDKTDDLVSKYICKIKSLDELNKSILQIAFFGELT